MKTLELFSLEDRVAVVVGGAGQIGAQTCEAFLGAGAKVAVVDLMVDASEVGDRNRLGVPTDIVDQTSMSEARDEVLDRFGQIDILVNHAHYKGDPKHLRPGHDFFAPFEEYPLDIWKATIDVNLTGLFLACQTFGSVMAAAGRGSVVNTSSTYGIVSPQHGMYGDSGINSPIAYATTKSAILNFSRYLATYWAEQGVRVNTISPGGVRNIGQSEEFVEAYESRTPLGRMAEPTDYQGAMVFLASDASSYMTGANLVVDGGWTAW